jgi:hypothetical protein
VERQRKGEGRRKRRGEEEAVLPVQFWLERKSERKAREGRANECSTNGLELFESGGDALMSEALHLAVDEEDVGIDVGERVLVKRRVLWTRQPFLEWDNGKKGERYTTPISSRWIPRGPRGRTWGGTGWDEPSWSLQCAGTLACRLPFGLGA